MPYWYRLVGGLPLHVVLVLLKFAKCSKLSSFLVKFKVLLREPNRQRICGKPNVLHPNPVVAVAFALWICFLCLHYAHGWPPAPLLQQ